jgi:hypothetical protein
VKIYSYCIEKIQEPNLDRSQINTQDVSLSEPVTKDSDDKDLEDLVSNYINSIHAKKLKPFIGL